MLHWLPRIALSVVFCLLVFPGCIDGQADGADDAVDTPDAGSAEWHLACHPKLCNPFPDDPADYGVGTCPICPYTGKPTTCDGIDGPDGHLCADWGIGTSPRDTAPARGAGLPVRGTDGDGLVALQLGARQPSVLPSAMSPMRQDRLPSRGGVERSVHSPAEPCSRGDAASEVARGGRLLELASWQRVASTDQGKDMVTHAH